MDYQLVNNKANNQYEYHLEDGEIALVEYTIDPETKTMYLTHTEVPTDHRGQNIANHLVHDVLEDIKAQGYNMVPVCPFIVTYVKRNPQYLGLIWEGLIQ